MVLGEDQIRARADLAAANLSVARRLALNLLRQDKAPERSIERRQMRAAFDRNYLATLLKL